MILRKKRDDILISTVGGFTVRREDDLSFTIKDPDGRVLAVKDRQGLRFLTGAIKDMLEETATPAEAEGVQP